jgi:hypothetical protein
MPDLSTELDQQALQHLETLTALWDDIGQILDGFPGPECEGIRTILTADIATWKRGNLALAFAVAAIRGFLELPPSVLSRLVEEGLKGGER